MSTGGRAVGDQCPGERPGARRGLAGGIPWRRIFVCISASPEFLLAPIIQDLNFQMLIGSIFKVTDTKIVNQMVSKNCKGMEKIHRLNAVFKDGYTIDQFYSDHPDDAPLFKLANESYLVKNGKISPLPDNFL